MKIYKPTTPGTRGRIGEDFGVLTKKEPEKSLIFISKKHAGRNNQGRITVRHRGGGVKQQYRIIDFNQTDKMNMPAKVLALEYDPNRTSFIALVQYEDNEKRYILAPQNLKVGDTVVCSENAPLNSGNRLKLKNIPIGTPIYNIELQPRKGGQIVRSAGISAKLLGCENRYAHIELPSHEIRMVLEDGFASVGVLSRPEHNLVRLGKAGRIKYKDRRPHVRGTAMNPHDHPHGGGEGRTGRGMKYPKTPWGKPAWGVRTRKKHKYSDKYIIQRRKK